MKTKTSTPSFTGKTSVRGFRQALWTASISCLPFSVFSCIEAVDHEASNKRFGTRYVNRNFVSASSGVDSVYLELSADSAEITYYPLTYSSRPETFKVQSDRDDLLKLEHSPLVPGKTVLEVYLRVNSTPDSIFLLGLSSYENFYDQPDSEMVKGKWRAENPVHGHAPSIDIEITDSTLQRLSPRDEPRPLSLHEDTSFCEGCYVDPKAGVLFKRSGKYLYLGGLHIAGYRKE